MTRPVAVPGDYRRQLWLVLAIWALASALLAWAAVPNIREWRFPDPDDAMRLMEVRDWLAGQSWFDVTQYRLNGPAGGPMHWSRLVDLPIAAVMLIARPTLGPHGAETAALILVPLLTLATAMLLVHRIAYKLMPGPAALLAVLATPLSLGALKQMKVMRIDHHGWQIVAALAAMLAMLDQRPRRSGIVAGLAMAVWLNISAEGLPFAVAVGSWFAWQWLADAAAGERLRSFLAALAGGSFGLFALTHLPSAWFAHPHDALNIAHFAGFAAAWLCCLIAVRPAVQALPLRIALLGLAGAISLGTMFAVDPGFLKGPFSSLDPLVAALWYAGVDEGLPVWRLVPVDAAIGMAQPLVGLAGALLAIRKAPAAQRDAWIAYCYFLLAGTLLSAIVIRAATTTSVLSLPGTAFLCLCAVRRARTLSFMPARVVATTAAALVMAPAYAGPALVAPANPRLNNAMDSYRTCAIRLEVEKLNALPSSNLAIPLDITPAILASSHHRAIASGYHRNVSGIHDVIVIFAGQPDQARAILARRQIDYVVFCPNAPESIRWEMHGPGGLASMLNAGRAPEWLQPVDLQTRGLRIWRVRNEVPATP